MALSPRPRGISAVGSAGEIKTLAKDAGERHGLAEMDDGSLLATDRKSGALVRGSPKTGTHALASGVTGPAAFCVGPEAAGPLVVVPDLAKSELRMARLGKQGPRRQETA